MTCIRATAPSTSGRGGRSSAIFALHLVGLLLVVLVQFPRRTPVHDEVTAQQLAEGMGPEPAIN